MLPDCPSRQSSGVVEGFSLPPLRKDFPMGVSEASLYPMRAMVFDTMTAGTRTGLGDPIWGVSMAESVG